MQKVAFVIIVSVSTCLHARSIFRCSSQQIPYLSIRWRGDNVAHILQHPNLEVGPLFTNYDRVYLEQHALPKGPIPPRNAHNVSTYGTDIMDILERFVDDLHHSYKLRKYYKDVIIIKKKDYNPRSHSGLIIVKLRNHPFVAKIFIESPSSFAAPFSKGFEPIIFFMMGSINRHVSGFLRIKNAEVLRELITQDPYWSTRVDIPRKWFWTAHNQQFLELTSAHLGTHEHRIVIPSVYAVIADAIVSDQEFHMFNRDHREQALAFCHFVGIRVDPHINNFMIEKGTGKLILVDTEHFPSMVGLRDPFTFANYKEWYFKLSCKGTVDCFGRIKSVRKKIQTSDARLVLAC